MFSAGLLVGADLSWKVADSAGDVIAEGRHGNITAELNAVTELPRITIGPIEANAPVAAVLQMSLAGSGFTCENSWPLWLFPERSKPKVNRKVYASAALVPQLRGAIPHVAEAGKGQDRAALWVTDDGETASRWLGEAKEVLFLPHWDTNRNPYDPGWFEERQMGTVIYDHGLLGDFPHNGRGSMQFRNLINRAHFIQEGFTPVTPIVATIFGADKGWPHLQHQLFSVRSTDGGHLIYCQLKVVSSRCEARYLLQELVANARPFDADPEVPLSELIPFLLRW
jgi:hypothetical protein